MLETVKSMLGITGTFQDGTIGAYIDEVKQFLLDGGVDESIVNSTSSAGVIARGVADLWNYGSGEGKLSEYFLQRAVQLSYKNPVNSIPMPEPDPEPSPEPDEIPELESYYTKDEVDELIGATYIESDNIEIFTTAETDCFDFPRRV